MRIVAEYLRKAAKFDEWARASREPILKENCADLADCTVSGEQAATALGMGAVKPELPQTPPPFRACAMLLGR